MKFNSLKFLALVMVVSTLSFPVALPLTAHHGNAAYDTENKITVKGTVTQWFWANPHCVLQFDAKDDAGQLVHWGAETENPTTMSHTGWTKASFKPGDEVTVTMITVRNGKPIGRIVEVALPNGQKLAGRVLSQQPAYSHNPDDPSK